MFTSPRQDVQVAYLPESRYGGWKITQCHEPLGMPIWSAAFSENTPAEIVSAFTTALGDDQRCEARHALSHDPQDRSWHPAGVLADLGWHHQDDDRFLYLHAPDGRAYLRMRRGELADDVELRGDGPALWTMHAGIDEVAGERWHADFTAHTPLHLLAATARAFSSADPVERTLADIPERNLLFITATPVDEHAATRQSAALARTPNAPPIRPASPPPPAASHPAAHAPTRHR
ncbi:DUF317 domain-containing protein [Streptantibioticus ferralitis]|uniref:DUF317 domain-containing protein n=1 Tax=Streptantibioticus ferralitis TaxID=236510 RepID=A0ABT5YS38_9ACTN|nr:DUF317 domain-containing protein [Streptantibioticus ferralitis]MDF2254354.1 DUF317 domain-containing protein [Streptantibioticus ferralitis]